ncbi:MAG: CDP-glucose 4,6-dehydratase [Planctomycetota bacterium]
MFADVYQGRRVLVTGHSGFKGSWLVAWLERLGARVLGYSLGPLAEPSHWSLLGLESPSVWGDIGDAPRLDDAVERFQPQIIFHLAAQPLVRASYDDPVATYQTNVIGTLRVLEAARRAGSARAVVVVTTDKCYENREQERGYTEEDAMGGYDPYSSSKGCAELATSSYRRSFFHPDAYGNSHRTLIASVRAGNVIGGGDWAVDRLLPDAVRAVGAGRAVEIRKPEATRPWQHVLDPLSGYLLLGQRLLAGDTACATGWNLGPQDAPMTVREVLERFCESLPDLRASYGTEKPDRHEANLLQLDCSKAQRELGWRPVWDGRAAIDATARWYADFLNDGTLRTADDLSHYLDDAATARVGWAGA